MKTTLKWIALGIAALVALAVLEEVEPWKKVTMILGGIIGTLYYQLSKQITENHKKVTEMLENTYRAAAGLPRE